VSPHIAKADSGYEELNGMRMTSLLPEGMLAETGEPWVSRLTSFESRIRDCEIVLEATITNRNPKPETRNRIYDRSIK